MISSFHALAERANYSTLAALGFIGALLVIAAVATASAAVVVFLLSLLIGFSFATGMVSLWVFLILAAFGIIVWSGKR